MRNEYKYNNTIEDYKEIHKYVLEYQNGKRKANIIIKKFINIINMYTNLIFTSNVKTKIILLNFKTIRNFIGMFMKKEDRKHIHSFKKKGILKNKLLQTLDNINFIFNTYTKEDIRNQLICALLKMAKNYKDVRPSFHNYVNKCFHYYAYSELKLLMNNPLIDVSKSYTEEIDTQDKCKEKYNIDYNKIIENTNSYYKIKNSKLITINNKSTPFDDNWLDNNWINGVTCSSIFQKIPPTYKRILVMYYIKKMTDEQIANKLGTCRVTINIKRNKAIKILKNQINK